MAIQGREVCDITRATECAKDRIARLLTYAGRFEADADSVDDPVGRQAMLRTAQDYRNAAARLSERFPCNNCWKKAD